MGIFPTNTFKFVLVFNQCTSGYRSSVIHMCLPGQLVRTNKVSSIWKIPIALSDTGGFRDGEYELNVRIKAARDNRSFHCLV